MSTETRYKAVNAVTAVNELRPGINTSVVNLLIREDQILDPFFNKPVEQAFSFSDPRYSRESEVNLHMLWQVRDQAGLGVWLSPPDPQLPTGKILVAKRDGNSITQYDTTGNTFSASEFAAFDQKLYPYRQDGYFFIPSTVNPWEILSQTIPMPQAWQRMQNHQAETEFQQEVKLLLDQASLQPSSARNISDLFREYYQLRDHVNISLACQPTLGLLASSNSLGVPVNFFAISAEGLVSKFIRNCGQCKVELNLYMKKGDQCPHCHGKYQGC